MVHFLFISTRMTSYQIMVPTMCFFEVDRTVIIKIKCNVSLNAFKHLIHEKLGLEKHQKISQLIYIFPDQLTLFQFSAFEIKDVQDK